MIPWSQVSAKTGSGPEELPEQCVSSASERQPEAPGISAANRNDSKNTSSMLLIKFGLKKYGFLKYHSVGGQNDFSILNLKGEN